MSILSSKSRLLLSFRFAKSLHQGRGCSVISPIAFSKKGEITSGYLYQTRKKTRIFENTPVKNTEIYAIPILFPSRFILNS